ncbi:MAG TPA: hypothetical protein VHM24_08865 [Gemmatimonadaceae bacterium]|nr:hypothetical protein [Gemmatimonadaceae bacterium]
MLLVREVFHCKPGKVRALVEKSLKMAKLSEDAGMGKMKIMTDLCGDRYWTIVYEMEVPNLQAFEDMMEGKGQSPESMKEFEKIMEGYHDLVDHGHREIYKIEA